MFDESIDNAARAIQLCEKAGKAEDAGFAYAVLQWACVFKGDINKAIALKEDVLRKMSEQFNLRVYTRTHYNTSAAYAWLGQWDKAEEEGRKALSVAQHYGDNSIISIAAFYLSYVYNHKGDVKQALKYAELADEKALTPAEKAWAQGVLGISWCRSGQGERGTKSMKSIVEAAWAGRHLATVLSGALWLAEGYSQTGEYDKARQSANEVRDLAEKSGACPLLGWAHRALGEIALKTNLNEAVAHFEKAISIFQEIKAENELALAYSGMGRYYKLQGNTERAREYLTQALEILERLGTLIEPDKVREELAELPR